MKKKPNFIIAGGVATGTSFLSHSIKDHPQIYLPKIMRPECGFFYKTWDHNKGEEYYLQNWFHEVQENHIAIGERSSLYIHAMFNQQDGDVAKKIHAMYPDMKLIFCLRNPTERAYANYRFSVMSGYENLSFKEAIQNEESRMKNEKGWRKEIQPNVYKGRGLYFEELSQFYKYFKKEQILCIKSETLSKNTDAEIKKTLNFLGVDENYQFKPEPSFTSPNVKNQKLQVLYRKIFGKKFDVLTENVRKEVKDGFFQKLVALNMTNDKMPMNPADRAALNEFYAKPNQQLSDFLGWDLSDWK